MRKSPSLEYVSPDHTGSPEARLYILYMRMQPTTTPVDAQNRAQLYLRRHVIMQVAIAAIVAGRPTPMPTPSAILSLSLKPPPLWVEEGDCEGDVTGLGVEVVGEDVGEDIGEVVEGLVVVVGEVVGEVGVVPLSSL